MYTKRIAQVLLFSLLAAAPLQAMDSNNGETVVTIDSTAEKKTKSNDKSETPTAVKILATGLVGTLLFYATDYKTSYYDVQHKKLPLNETIKVGYSGQIVVDDELYCKMEAHAIDIATLRSCSIPHCYRFNHNSWDYCSHNLEITPKSSTFVVEHGIWKGSKIRDYLTWLRQRIIGKTEKEIVQDAAEVAASLDHGDKNTDNEKGGSTPGTETIH